MALLHRAEIRPTKTELITGWLPSQPWYAGGAQPELQRLGSYRFDDPAGEVGVDIHLVRAGGQTLQVPLTYRNAPLDGGEPWLIGTTEHTVLGSRWVYDGCGDPVCANALAAAILADGKQAEEYFEIDGRREFRAPTASVTGGGSARELRTADTVTDLSCSTEGAVTTIRAAGWELRINRVIDPKADAADAHSTLTGTWSGQTAPVVLASATFL